MEVCEKCLELCDEALDWTTSDDEYELAMLKTDIKRRHIEAEQDYTFS